MSARAAGAFRTAGGGLPPEVLRVAVVVIVGAIMSILDTTIVNVALESLSRDLDAPLSTVQWVATGYLLALATVIPLTGWAAERFGTKRVWMTVVAAFVVTSGLCGLAWSADALIGFRVLQGLAGGMIMPIGMITLAQAAGPQRVGRVMSVVGVPMLLGPVLGPVIGGLLVEHGSWRWIFYVNLPIGIVGLLLAARLLPEGRAQGREGDAGRLDWRGLVLLSPGVALLVYGLSEMGSTGEVLAAGAIGPVLAGLFLIAAFGRHAWRSRFPLVDVHLLRHRGFAAATVTVLLVGAALFGGMLLLPLYYQLDRGLSALQAGLLLAPQGLGAAVAMRASGELTDRVGGGPVVVSGLAILTLGTIPFALVGPDTSYAWLVAALAVRGVGLGFTMMPTMASAYALLDRSQVPRATPLLNVTQRIGGSLGTAVLAVVLQRGLEGAGGGAGGGDASARALPAAARRRLAEPIAGAFGHAYLWSLGLTAVAMVPAVVLWREQRRARRAAARTADPQGTAEAGDAGAARLPAGAPG